MGNFKSNRKESGFGSGGGIPRPDYICEKCGGVIEPQDHDHPFQRRVMVRQASGKETMREASRVLDWKVIQEQGKPVKTDWDSLTWKAGGEFVRWVEWHNECPAQKEGFVLSSRESAKAYRLVHKHIAPDVCGTLPQGTTAAQLLEAWRYVAQHWKAREQAGKCAPGFEWAPFWAEHKDTVMELKARVEG